MRIGELSARTGVSVRMLRHYEKQGLLHPSRMPSGYRAYTSQDAGRVKEICLLNAAGIPLSSMQTLLGCLRAKADAAPLCEALQSKIRTQLTRIDQQMAALDESRSLLGALLGGSVRLEADRKQQ